MLKVGLTGGIGSGKSTVSSLFAKLGVHIIDTDLIARDLVESERAALKTLSEHFGKEILNADGSLNRAQLREYIFKHPQERQWLENLLHPLIRQEVQQQIQSDQGSYIIVVIPLLTENYRQDYPFLDRICVVDCEESLQILRAATRDDISAELAANMIKSQLSRAVRLTLADDIITNNHDLSALESQVMALHQKYLSTGLPRRSTSSQ